MLQTLDVYCKNYESVKLVERSQKIVISKQKHLLLTMELNHLYVVLEQLAANKFSLVSSSVTVFMILNL